MDNLGQPKLSRRKFVQRSVMAGAATSLLPGTSRAAKATPSVPTGPNLYEQLGVRPLINATLSHPLFSDPEIPQGAPANVAGSGTSK